MTEFLPTCLVRNKLRKGLVFVNVEANQGYFAFLAAKRTKKVIAFEPVPLTYKKFEAGIYVNGNNNFELHEIALGSENSQLKMNLESFQSSVSGDGSSKMPLNKLVSCQTSKIR